MNSYPEDAIVQMDYMLDSGRQIFGLPGAGLTWGIKGDQTVDISIGIEGERMVGKIVNKWVLDHPNVLVFHSIRCPNLGDADTDHLLVMGQRVVLIDSKRWMSKRKYSINDKGNILRNTVSFPEGKQVTIRPQMKMWRDAVPEGVSVTGVVAIAQSEVFVPYDDNWKKSSFRLVTAERLTETLDYYYKRAKKDLQISADDDLPLWQGVHAMTFASRLIKPRISSFMKQAKDSEQGSNLFEE